MTSAAHGATAQERLLMEQIDQLAGAGQFVEAVANMRRLVDNSQGRLIEEGQAARAATQTVQIHIPIARWSHERLFRWSQAAGPALGKALGSENEQAIRALASAGLNAQSIQRGLDRFPLADACVAARLQLSDLYLDRGWTTAARQALDAPALAWRVATPDDQPPANGLLWPSAWPHLRESTEVAALMDRSWQSMSAQLNGNADQLKLASLERCALQIAMDGTDQEVRDTLEWIEAMGRRLPDDYQPKLKTTLQDARRLREHRATQTKRATSGLLTFAGDALRRGNDSLESDRLTPSSWPKWSRQIERITGAADHNPASKPPVAENVLGLLPYHPLVHGGRIYVNELTRVMAYDLKDGKSWPRTESSLPLYDSGLTAASYLPFGYQIMGAPRGTLTIDRQVLYARQGPPVTGWFGRPPSSEARSLSYLIALDLERQGSMRPGFPVHLAADEFPNSEFEGAPLVSGDQVIVCLSTRDNVNLRRSLVSIDRRNGQVQWRSPVLASGMVSGSEQFSLIAHQLPTIAGGRIFVSTNLGSVACVNQADGSVVWLARYRRGVPQSEEAYPKPDRYRYRDMTPCIVVGTQVICAPQDCPEIFSLDITTGQLLWSTDSEQVDDATQILGMAGRNLIVAGDRIYWLRCDTGQVQACFPGGSVGEVSNALPAPRGYGRGAIRGDRVYWPTASEIFVFDAEQTGPSAMVAPVIRDRIRLDVRGSEGGNLVLWNDGLMIAAASRLFVYQRAE